MAPRRYWQRPPAAAYNSRSQLSRRLAPSKDKTGGNGGTLEDLEPILGRLAAAIGGFSKPELHRPRQSFRRPAGTDQRRDLFGGTVLLAIGIAYRSMGVFQDRLTRTLSPLSIYN